MLGIEGDGVNIKVIHWVKMNFLGEIFTRGLGHAKPLSKPC
jgi:hypothetical protein